MPSPIWVPGVSPYGEWLKKLTPEEKEDHLKQRRAKKSLKKSQQMLDHARLEFWLSAMNEVEMAMLAKAKNGDVQAYIALHDRKIGKPTETIITESEEILPWNSTETEVGPDNSPDEDAD